MLAEQAKYISPDSCKEFEKPEMSGTYTTASIEKNELE